MPFTPEDDEWLNTPVSKAPRAPAKARSPWQRFKDSYLEGALHSGLGAEPVVRAVLKAKGHSSDEINRAERRLSDDLIERRRRDEEAFKDSDTWSPANIGKHVVDLAGGILGGVDPTYVLAPGKSILQRMGAQGAINAGVDAGTQGVELTRGVRDEWNWDQTALAGAGGVVLQGAGEVAGRARLGQRIRRGSRKPDFDRIVDITIHSESRGNDNAVSPVGARGKMQVMPGTARDPGFGIRRSDGSKADDARVGRQYLAVMMDRYDGDMSKVWAAYNWGPGNLDKAMKRHGGEWLRHAPRETRNYVAQNTRLLGGNRADPGEASGENAFVENVRQPVDWEARRASLSNDNVDESVERGLMDDMNVDPFTQNAIMSQDISFVPQGFIDNAHKFDSNQIEDIMARLMDGEKVDLDAELQKAAYPVVEDGSGRAARSSIPPSRGQFAPIRDPANDMGGDPIAAAIQNDIGNARGGNDNVVPTAQPDLRPAIRDVDGKVYVGEPGAGHMNVIEKYPNLKYDDDGGFVDASGKYLTRREAAKLGDTHAIVGLEIHDAEVRGIWEEKEALRDAWWEDKISDDVYYTKVAELDKRIESFGPDPVITDGSGRAARSTVPNTREPYPPTRDPANDFDDALPGVRQDKGNAIEENDNVPSKKKGPLQTLKDIIDDDEGTFRPFGRKSDPEGPDGEGPNGSNPTVQKLREAIEAALPKSAEQRKNVSEERSRRLGKVAAAQKVSGGEAGFHAELSQLKGAMAKAEFPGVRDQFTQDDIDELFDIVKNHKPGTLFDTINARNGLKKIFDGQVPTKNELDLLSEIFPKDMIKTLSGTRGLGAKLKHIAANVLNLPRSLMSSFDLSAPFRQGVFLVGRKEFYTAFAGMFKQFGSAKAHEAVMMEIKSRPSYGAMKRAGLSLTDVDGALSQREEDFMSDWAPRIPLIGAGVRASTRAYSGFLNRLRADVFDDILTKSKLAGVNFYRDPKALTDIAKYVNAATGRGSLGKRLNAAAPLLSGLLFSPRLMASRITMLNPMTYVNLSPVVRKEAVKNLLTFGMIAGTVLGIGSMGGLDVSTDLRSSDGLKMKQGNTRFDILGGFQQYLKLGVQLATGQKIDAKGRLVELGKGYKADTRLDVIETFFASKASPVASFVADALRGRNIIGEEFKLPDDVIKRFIPLFMQDVTEAYDEFGAKGVLTVVPAIFGVGVQTYKPRAPKEKEEVNEDEWNF